MAVRVERDLDAGVPHLVAYERCRLVVRDQLRREEMPQVVKASSGEAGLGGDRLPDLGVELVRVDEARTVAGEKERAVGLPDLEIGEHLHDAFGCGDAPL